MLLLICSQGITIAKKLLLPQIQYFVFCTYTKNKLPKINPIKAKSKKVKNDCPCKKVRIYDHFHGILRLFDVVPKFSFTTSKVKRNYYLYVLYLTHIITFIQVNSRAAAQFKTYDLRKVRN